LRLSPPGPARFRNGWLAGTRAGDLTPPVPASGGPEDTVEGQRRPFTGFALSSCPRDGDVAAAGRSWSTRAPIYSIFARNISVAHRAVNGAFCRRLLAPSSWLLHHTPMDTGLEGKAALVGGASRGIG